MIGKEVLEYFQNMTEDELDREVLLFIVKNGARTLRSVEFVDKDRSEMFLTKNQEHASLEKVIVFGA